MNYEREIIPKTSKEKQEKENEKDIEKFKQENQEKIENISSIFHNAPDLDSFLETKSELFDLLNQDLDQYNLTPCDVFKTFISEQYADKRKQELSSLQEGQGLYEPLEKEENKDGGDSWMMFEKEDKKTGVIIDTVGHGEDSFFKKIFLEKAFFLLEKESGEEKKEGLKKINDFFAGISDYGESLSCSFVRAEIDKKNGDNRDRELELEVYGDVGCMIFNPETKEIKEVNLSQENFQGNRHIKKLDCESEKPCGLVKVPLKWNQYKTTVPQHSRVILFTDGLKNGDEESLIEQLNKELEKKDCDQINLIDFLRRSLDKKNDDISALRL